MITPPQSAVEMDIMARSAIASLPTQLGAKLRNVVIRVDEFASAEQLKAVDIENRWNLTGLYEGTPLPEKSVWATTDMPPVISLFRQPLLREWRETGVEWDALVRHVVIHEAGHHFGFSDEEMHALEDEVD